MIDDWVWEEVRAAAGETPGSIDSRLSDVARQTLAESGIRPAVLADLWRSIEDNRRLGELLAR
ncbi:MAG: hypothetical protein RIE74_19635 [Pseudomonadales bacterium]